MKKRKLDSSEGVLRGETIMKILYIAFECCPNSGSECALGWSWPFYMRDFEDVSVLTRLEHRSQIEKYLTDNNITNIKYYYCDIPRWMNFYERTGKFWLLYYKIWQLSEYFYLKKLQAKENFDVIHHVSMNEFRTIGFENRIKTTKYIFGPTGGGQVTPKVLKYYTKRNRKEEFFREVINAFVKFNPFYHNGINRAAKIFFINDETMNYLLPCIKDRSKCELLTDVGVSQEYLLQTKQYKEASECLFTFLWSGRMVYRKGLDLLFDALDKLDSRLEYRVILCGDGPEKDRLVALAEEKGIKNKIDFRGKLSFESMQQTYREASAFIFPSLRETSGAVLLEAMSNYLPVIGLAQGGTKEIVSNNEGFLIEGNTKEEYIENLSNAIYECIKNPGLVLEKGKRARKRVEEEFTWEAKIKFMHKFYEN